MREELHQLLEMFEYQAHLKGVELELQLEKEVPDTMTGDPRRLGQVIVNLLSNALKFT